MTKAEAAELIASYRAAFERANGRECDALIYERGWFIFRGPFVGRYRAAKLRAMLATLEDRIAAGARG